MRVTALALLVPALTGIATVDASWTDPVIEPEVRAHTHAGRARVLVVLRVAESEPDAIERAQEAVVSRLPRAHASVVRRYSSIPLLALEIDATALRALEAMPDVIVGVRLDRAATPQ